MPAPRLGRPKGESPNDPIAGVFWVTLSMALLAGLAAFSRAAINAGLHPFEVVFLRNLFAVTMLLPLLAWRGWSLARSDQIGLYGWRVAISLFSMQAWFYAIALIPIGEVTAISFLSRCSARWARSSCWASACASGAGRRCSSASWAP